LRLRAILMVLASAEWDGKALVALGRVVLSKRERVMALEPYGTGLLGTTLRYPYEVRHATDFGEIPDPASRRRT
jgi:non-homologous end joining protein Ku